MIMITKQVICPQCGRVMDTRTLEYRRDVFEDTGDIVSDMICRKCREQKELEIIKRANRADNNADG